MKKKGFTLIELLAVIVIIALITLITVPVIGNIIENSKKEAFKRSVEGLAREYEYREVQTDSKLGNIDACALQDSGTTCNIRGTIDRDDDGDIIIDVENGKYTAKGKIGEMTVTNCDESVGGENQGSGQGSGENNNNENNNENNSGNNENNNGNNENNNGNNNSGNENNETNQNTPTPDLINISSATIDPIQAVNYDGTAKTPNVVVKYNNVLLTKNTDYIVAYSNNINVGTATVLVTGKGNYTGTKTASFTIKEAAKNISGATIDPIQAVNYDGTAKTPTIIVKYNNVLLTKNTDYIVAYSNNINVGTATVLVTGIGNYTGTKTASFTIKEAAKNISGATIDPIQAVNYDGTAKTPIVIVKYNNVPLTQNTDYTVAYSNNINVGTAIVTITGKGNYTGTKDTTFVINSINPPNTSVVPETNLKYNGLEQSLIKSTDINGDVYYNVGTELNSSNYLSSGNTTKPKRVDAGTYIVYYYVPANGNYNEVKGSVTSKINPKTLYAPYGGSSEYTGSTQNSGITCPTGSTAGGTKQAIEIGTYTQTCTLSNTNNYKWYDTNSSVVSIEWNILKPTINGYTYDAYSTNFYNIGETIGNHEESFSNIASNYFYAYDLNSSNKVSNVHVCTNVGSPVCLLYQTDIDPEVIYDRNQNYMYACIEYAMCSDYDVAFDYNYGSFSSFLTCDETSNTEYYEYAYPPQRSLYCYDNDANLYISYYSDMGNTVSFSFDSPEGQVWCDINVANNTLYCDNWVGNWLP